MLVLCTLIYQPAASDLGFGHCCSCVGELYSDELYSVRGDSETLASGKHPRLNIDRHKLVVWNHEKVKIEIF